MAPIILKKKLSKLSSPCNRISWPHPADEAEKITQRDAIKTTPSSIYAVYSTDLDILQIHMAVRDRFISLYGSVGLLFKEIELAKKALVKSITEVDRVGLETDIKLLESNINSIISGSAWMSYVTSVGPILNRYCEINDRVIPETISPTTRFSSQKHNESIKQRRRASKKTLRKSNGVSPKRKEHVTQETVSVDSVEVFKNRERINLINKYIEIAKKFIDLNAYMVPIDVSACSICGQKKTVKDEFVIPEFGMRVCGCGRETIGTAPNNTYRDSRIDIGTRNSYDDLVNFVKRIDAFEGNQKTKPPDAIYRQIDEYFKKTGSVAPSDEIRELGFIENGKKPGTSVELLSEALLATNNSSFYKDIEIIGHTLWGWKLANLTTSGLRDKIINDYVTTQPIYHEIKKRESSLNVNLRLYFHLTARNYDCHISDFKVLSSQDSIIYHNECFEIMAKRTGLTFVPIPFKCNNILTEKALSITKNHSLKTGGERTGDAAGRGAGDGRGAPLDEGDVEDLPPPLNSP